MPCIQNAGVSGGSAVTRLSPPSAGLDVGGSCNRDAAHWNASDYLWLTSSYCCAQQAGVSDGDVITRLSPPPAGLDVGGRRLRQASFGAPLDVTTQIASPNPSATQAQLQRSLDSGSLGSQLQKLGWSLAPSPQPARVGVRCPAPSKNLCDPT